MSVKDIIRHFHDLDADEAAQFIETMAAEHAQMKSAINSVLDKWSATYNGPAAAFGEAGVSSMSALSMHDLRGMMIHLRASLILTIEEDVF